RFVTEDIFGNTARERDELGLDRPFKRLGKFERFAERIARGAGDLVDRQGSEPFRNRVTRLRICKALGCRCEAKLSGDALRRIVNTRPHSLLILRKQPAADRKGGNAPDLPLVDQCKLGGAAADVDMKYAGMATPRQGGRAGPVRRQDGLEFMAGGGADEFPRV